MICSKAALSPAAARSTKPARAVWFRLGASSGNGISTARAICKAALGISATNRLPTLIYRPQEQNVEKNYREFERGAQRDTAINASKVRKFLGVALPKNSGLAQSAKRTSENSPALQCWVSSPGRTQSVKRTTDKSSTAKPFRIQPSVSRTVAPDHADPTDESVGYYQSSAAPTFWAKPLPAV